MTKNVITAKDAKKITVKYLESNNFSIEDIKFGLPEIVDRFNIWKVPIMFNSINLGDICINIDSLEVNKQRSSNINILISRKEKILAGKIKINNVNKKRKSNEFQISSLKNSLIKGYAQVGLKKLPENSIDLIFTSPPYFNAKKEYSEYDTYEDYLNTMREIIIECKRVLMDGKFFVINSSHVLIPRTSRSESSRRIAVPFDLHQIFIEEGFEFVDDIIWQKPEGAGWSSGRGRRFAADRNAMQYKAVPVTEYVMVYRKKPCILIDHFIRNNPNKNIVESSKIDDNYEKTNIWYISPARDKRHPAIFPRELAEKVVKYYSFKNDVVLDPFAGIGTTAITALILERRFCAVECNDEYVSHIKNELSKIKNNLFFNYEYEFIDCSNEKFMPVNNINLKKELSLLLENGITKEEIYKMLSEIKKKHS